MTASTVFFLLLVLACPLMMIFMMRGHGHGGGHAGHGGGFGSGNDHEPGSHQSIDELCRQRDELDRLIEERERSEAGHQLETSGSARR